MARKEPTGSGGARRTRGSHAGAQKRGHGRKRSQATRRKAKTASLAETTVTEHPAAGSAWHAGAGAVGSATPLLALAADQPASLGVSLTLAGAEQATLHDALQAWGVAQDEAANRAWRRPGGLTRMAGL